MKKITLLLLAAMLLPMTMNAEVKTYVQQNKKATNVVVSKTPTAMKATKTVQIKSVGPKADVPEGYASVTLTAGDVWQDGSGYQMLLDADATAYGTIIPETGGLTTSGDATAETYAEFEYKIPENADGAMTTQNIVLNNSVTILIPAGTYDFCITNPTPGDRIWIASENGNVSGRMDDFEFASGAGYEFSVALQGQNDAVTLTVDDPTAPAIPTDVAVTPTATTGEVTWVAGENNASWNLRWRPYVDPALASVLWDLPVPGYEDQVANFMIYDADGDGNNWGLAYSSDAQNDACFTSASYSGGALTPDNWLITPVVGLGGTLKFKAWQQSATYPDKIMVYVCDNPEWESTDEFVAISEFIQPAGTAAESFEFDLSDYEGTGVIAFRHYDCNDQWAIYVDDIEVIPANPVEIPEWTFVENVTSPYTIEGLTPETEYEVQVQGVGADARTTDWTESVHFVTLAEGQQPEPTMDSFYLIGTFNGWDQAEGLIEFTETENNTYMATAALEAGAEFKIVTPGEEGWIWFGGVDENQVGFFLINEGLFGVDIDLIDGSNFKVEEAGNYEIEIGEKPATPALGLYAPLYMKISPITGIDTISTEKVDNNWYNLQGVKFNGMPSVPGIYINNGKKVIIK